jgi:KipI family sensor histidine kinase inhibitor
MDTRMMMLGDSAWLVDWPPAVILGTRTPEVLATMRRLEINRPPGVTAVVAAYESLAVRYDPLAVDGNLVREWILECLQTPEETAAPAGVLHEIPVHYDGPDLKPVADATGLTPEEVVALHAGAEYTVAMVGFAPGFPYLTGLPEALRLPRLATPRNRVEAGAVAIAGEQAGIYPCASPGGWRVLGHTGLRLFDAARAGCPALLAPGDRVKFVPTDVAPAIEISKEPRLQMRGDLVVIEPGFSTTVQDGGRPFFESAGVSPGGAMDVEAMRVANLLLGNPDDASVLEICMKGPVLRFTREAKIVLVGADGTVGMRNGRSIDVAAGEVLDVGNLLGSLRAVLAVAGGIDLPLVLGARSTDVRAGFGGRVLRAGDGLDIGGTGEPCHSVDGVAMARPTGRDLVVRFLPGPQWERFEERAIRNFEHETFEVTTRQDRMGIRLHGPQLAIANPGEMRSQPVATGSIQVPPDGRPMVLMAERQTHGGYPQIGCLITADLPKLARALPGTRVRFHRVDPEQAWSAIRQRERDFQWLRAAMMCR